MSRFYITQIAASGPKVTFSSVVLKDGINFVVGPSNTGKSYIIGCIDFMLGSKECPFSKDDTGYDKIHMTLQSDDGYQITATRTIEEGESGDRGSNIIHIESTHPDIRSGEYRISTKEYSDFLLRLMGVAERTKIIAKQNITTEDLTFRTISHFFYISEDNIFEKSTAFDIPKHSKITASLTSLLFMMTGDNLKQYIPAISAADIEKKATQKAGVITYLNGKISELTEQKKKIVEDLAADTGIDVESKIDAIVSEIERVEQNIVDATEESRCVLEQIYTVNAKLQEARFLSSQYKALKTQYRADIKRLDFIADGSKKRKAISRKANCPFCGHDMEESPSTDSYMESAETEIMRIKLQLQDLEITEADAQADIETFEAELRTLNTRNEKIGKLLNQQLRPKAQELRATVAEYLRILQLRQELASVSYMSTALSADAFEKANEGDETAAKFNAKDAFDKSVWAVMSESFNAMVKACAYPGNPNSYLDINTADAVVGGRHKKNQGKGYRAFLNTIMLFNLMKYLECKGRYAPHFLVLDSPILSLKEIKYQIADTEAATPGMKESLVRYMIENCGKNQVIIAENELPETVDYSSANLVTFTKTDEPGKRYGFLRTKPGSIPEQ